MVALILAALTFSGVSAQNMSQMGRIADPQQPYTRADFERECIKMAPKSGTRAPEVDRQMQARGTMSDRLIFLLSVLAAIAAIIGGALVYDAYQFHKRCGHGVLPAGCSWPVPGGF